MQFWREQGRQARLWTTNPLQAATDQTWRTRHHAEDLGGKLGAQTASKKTPPRTKPFVYPGLKPVFPPPITNRARRSVHFSTAFPVQAMFDGNRGFKRKHLAIVQPRARRLSMYYPQSGGGRYGRRVFRKKRFRKGVWQRSGYYGRFRANGSRVQELKFFDSEAVSTVIQAGVIVPSLLLIAEGTDPSERIGRKIIVKSLNIRTRILFVPTAGLANQGSQEVRYIVYVDHQANGATALTADILSAELNDNYTAYREMTKLERFTILCDKMVVFNAQAGLSSADTYPEQRISINKTLRIEVPVDYNAATGTLANICCDNIGILMVSRLDSAGAVTVHHWWRARFDG